jgi:hypothetical protein
MDEFESVFQTSPEDELQKEINDIKEQLTSVSPLGISSQVVSTLKRLTRRTYQGTGADGDATFAGGAVTGFTLSGQTYTQTADRNLANVTVASGYVIVGRQYLLFIKGTLQNNGTIYANGAWW